MGIPDDIILQDIRPWTQTVTAGITEFPFPWWSPSAVDVKAVLQGVELIYGADYTVTLEQNPQVGGTLTLLVTPALTTDVLTFWRDMPVERLANFEEGADLLAFVLNQDQDQQTAMVQQLQLYQAARIGVPLDAVGAPAMSLLVKPEAGKVLGWLDSQTLGNVSPEVVATTVAVDGGSAATPITPINFRRDSAVALDAIVPTPGEPLWDSSGSTFRVGDGSTSGGRIVGDVDGAVPTSRLVATLLQYNEDNAAINLLDMSATGTEADWSPNLVNCVILAQAEKRPIYIPGGDYTLEAPFIVPDGVTVYGDGSATRLIAGASFPASMTFAGKAGVPSAVVAYDGITAPADGVSGVADLSIEGSTIAPHAMLVSGGTQIAFRGLYGTGCRNGAFVLDNLIYSELVNCFSENDLEHDWVLLNGTAHNVLVGCHGLGADVAPLSITVSASYPGADNPNAWATPTRNAWYASRFAGAFLAARNAEACSFTGGVDNTFVDCDFAGSSSVAVLDVGATSTRTRFTRCHVEVVADAGVPDPRGINNAGVDTILEDCYLSGNASVTAFILNSQNIHVIRPIWDVTPTPTKHIESADTDAVYYMTARFQGSTRPTEIVDTTIWFFDTIVGDWIFKDPSTGVWHRASGGPAVVNSVVLDAGANPELDGLARYTRVSTVTATASLSWIGVAGWRAGDQLQIAITTDRASGLTLTSGAGAHPTSPALYVPLILGDATRVLNSTSDDILMYFNGSAFKELVFSDKA